jgi:GNAT superfamily N-acetyltransferase
VQSPIRLAREHDLDLLRTFGFSLESHGRHAFVDDPFIRPASRGADLGTRVLARVEDDCRRLGVRALHLEVERANRVAQSLYRRRRIRDNDRQLLTECLLEPPRCR